VAKPDCSREPLSVRQQDGNLAEAGLTCSGKGGTPPTMHAAEGWKMDRLRLLAGIPSVVLGWAGDAGHGEVVGGEFEDDLVTGLERIGEGGVGGEVGDDVLAIGKEGDPCAAVWAWVAEGAGGADGIGGWHGREGGISYRL